MTDAGWPLLYGEEGRELGVRWLRGILLHGPPGCGKTLLVQAVAAEYGAAVHPVSASNIFGAYIGEPSLLRTISLVRSGTMTAPKHRDDPLSSGQFCFCS